jgi:hypothetical protein
MRKRIMALIIFAVIAAASAISLILAYAFEFTDPVSAFAKKLAPIRVVGRHVVTAYDLNTAFSLAKNLDPQISEKEVLEELVLVEKKRTILEANNVRISANDVANELAFFKKERGEEYGRFISSNFRGNETLFTKFVAYPLAVDAKTRILYHSDKTRTKKSSEKAGMILKKLSEEDADFSFLAKEYSDDRVSGQFGGDLGFVTYGQILPELEQAAFIEPVGKPMERIIVSRSGYHLLFPVQTATEEGKKLWHIRHIFIEGEGFEQWLYKESSRIKVIKIRQ